MFLLPSLLVPALIFITSLDFHRLVLLNLFHSTNYISILRRHNCLLSLSLSLQKTGLHCLQAFNVAEKSEVRKIPFPLELFFSFLSTCSGLLWTGCLRAPKFVY